MQHLLLVVIGLLTCGLAFTLINWPGGKHMTFSQHAATTRASKIFYALLFLATLPLLMWFFIGWLAPEKNLPLAFTWFAAIAVLFQILCTWFPEEGGTKTVIHRTLTGISGVAMLPLLFIIATSSSVSSVVAAVVWVGLFFMFALLLIALKNQDGFKWALLLQIGYYAVFFAVLLTVTYV